MQVPPVHVLPQPPQFCESFCVLTHVPPQSMSGDGHTQLPPEQMLPPEQTFPHAPQLLGSPFV
jgi:hypothetical protein